MARRNRPNLPGVIFHVTSRTQGHAPWFQKGLRSKLIEIVEERIDSTDAHLLAYAIMPNHLHLVLRQGEDTLGRLLQPALQRIAILMQRVHALEGHVFERRFRSHPCLEAEYARNIIIYTHLNPVRAGLCEDPSDYGWSSHRRYRRHGTRTSGVEPALRLFAATDSDARLNDCASYDRFLNWRLAMDRYHQRTATGHFDEPLPSRPSTAAGDGHWKRHYAPSANGARRNIRPSEPVPGTHLRDIAITVLREHGRGPDLRPLRGPVRGPGTVRLRREIIARAAAAGHTNAKLINFFDISRRTLSTALSA